MHNCLRPGFPFLIALHVFIFSGCSITSSDGIATEKICLNATLETVDEESANLSVLFTVGCGIGATGIELEGEDEVTCEGKELRYSRNILNQPDYLKTFPLKAPGETYQCIFRRENESISFAFVSPEPFKITAPSRNSTFRIGEKLPTISWNSTVDSASVDLAWDALCLNNQTKTTEDIGKASFAGNVFEEHTEEPAPCEGDLWVRRTIKHSAPKEFSGGSIESKYVQKVPIQIKK